MHKKMEYHKIVEQPLDARSAVDLGKHDQVEALKIWHEEVRESETDVGGLCVSFLTVQACRFNISGVLPDTLGIEEENYTHPLWCTFGLYGCSLLFVILIVPVFLMYAEYEEKKPAPGSCESFMQRMVMVLLNAVCMAFAWCLLYGTKWEAARLLPFLGNPNMITGRVFLAMIISTFGVLLILTLDKIADAPWTGDMADAIIIKIIAAIGILVGFSWEQSFDGGVEVIAALTPQPILAEIGLTVLVVLIVLPAWRRHILQKVIDLQEEKEHKEKHEKEQRERGHAGCAACWVASNSRQGGEDPARALGEARTMHT